MGRDYTEIDRGILEAINSLDAVPTALALSKKGDGPTNYSPSFILKRLKENPALQKALEKKGIQIVTECDRSTFDNSVISGKWNNVPSEVRSAVLKRLDGYIILQIQQYEGVPSRNRIIESSGDSIIYGPGLIERRFKDNKSLSDAVEKRGREFVASCTRRTFDEAIHSKLWSAVPKTVRGAIYERLDQYILEAIESYSGVPNAYNLRRSAGGSLDYGLVKIKSRLDQNPALQEALEERGVGFVRTCDRETFDDSFTSYQWNTVPERVKKAIYQRLDEHILEAIDSFDGIPNSSNLSTSLGGPLVYGKSSIERRMELNPDISKAMERRGLEFIATCDQQTFDICLANNWNTSIESHQKAIVDRLDAYILSAISAFVGIPNNYNLSKSGGGPLGYSRELLGGRIARNPDIPKAMERRGKEFLATCDRKTFDELLSRGKLNTVSGEMAAIANGRLDGFIHAAIESFKGVPNTHNLSKRSGGPLDYDLTTIRRRVRENSELRKAIYVKRGMSEDQINALEAELDVPPPAFTESIKRRLPDTRVFREALGILKEFEDQLQGKLLEVSYYPQPIQRAADFLGIPVDGNLVRAQELKDPDFGIMEKFDTVVLVQCCHRISNGSLILAFNEANKTLSEAGVLLVTLPEEYSRTPAFETQVQGFGFEIQAEGTLFTRTLGLEELRAAGVADPERVKQKVEQATNVILLVKTRTAQGAVIDSFTKEKQENGNGTFHPSLGEINTPDKLLRDLTTIFQKATPGIGEGYLLSILDGSGVEQDLIGFDINPKEPRMVELSSADSPAISISELSQLARRMSKVSFREKMLVKPGRETKVPASFVRRVIKAA